jgi:NAD(P)-dependent dehydrogenase (short-subunit alcohol dehydrogenase family)
MPDPGSGSDGGRGAGLVIEATDLTGKTALMTGGTTGIGREVVRQLAERGVRVLTFGRHQATLDGVLAEVGGEGSEVHGVRADVSILDDVRRVFAEVDSRLGGLDILVNNAAISGEGFEEDPLERIEYMVRTNVVGYLACAHEAAARMKERGGHVVLIGSMSADLREPDGTSYVATKGAIQAMAESLRKTLNEEGIKVTLIEPGKVATEMVDATDAQKEEKIAALEMLRPDEVAGAVLYALLQPQRCDVVVVQLRPHRQVI